MSKHLAKHHLLNIMGWSTIVAVLIMVTTIIIWLTYPYKLIEFTPDAGQPDYVTNKTQYHQGEDGAYTVKYCKYTDLKPTVVKKFEDGIEFTADDTRAVLVQGCHTQQVSLHIPQTLPAGRYRLAIYTTYNLNPIRSVTGEHYSNWFTVIEDDTNRFTPEPKELNNN